MSPAPRPASSGESSLCIVCDQTVHDDDPAPYWVRAGGTLGTKARLRWHDECMPATIDALQAAIEAALAHRGLTHEAGAA